MELTWLGMHHRDLSPLEMHDLLMLRHDVFVIEQDCPDYRDIDGLDVAGDTQHVLGLEDERVVATARLLPPTSDQAQARIGRVAVAPHVRGSGAGHELMRLSLETCTQLWPGSDVLLAAQAHLEGFYRQHGFVPTGSSYVEDGIPHIDMVLSREGEA